MWCSRSARDRGAGIADATRRGCAASTPAFWACPRAGHLGERCAACGDCLLGRTGGICPLPTAQVAAEWAVRRVGGRALRVNPDIPCAWQLIYDRLSSLGKLDLLLDIQPPKNWKVARDGGPRKIVREDLRLAVEEE